MDVLPEVAEAVAGRAMIIIDGGFYRGSDIVKAIARGAISSGLGRMQCYALAARGSPASCACSNSWRTRSRARSGLMGVTSYAKPIRPICTRRAANAPHVLLGLPTVGAPAYRY